MSPNDIDSGRYCSAFPLPPLESMPVSGYSTINTVVNSPSDVGLFLSQGDINSWPPDIPAYAYSPQTDAVLGCLTYPAEPHPSIHGNFPFVHPSHAVKANLAPSMSTLRGSECFGPAPVTSNEDPTRVYLDGVDATRNWVEEGVSTDVSFEQGHRYIFIDGTSDFSVPSTPPEIPCISAVAQYQQQRIARPTNAVPENKKETHRSKAAASLLSSVAPKGLYSCKIYGCNKAYTQPQGLRRHYREKHKPSLCMYCCAFKWARLYRYKKHLEKEHPNVDLTFAP